MNSKQKSLEANIKEELQAGWIARMIPILEESGGIIDDKILAKMYLDLNNYLGDFGNVLGISYKSDDNKFVIVFEDEDENNNCVLEIPYNDTGATVAIVKSNLTDEEKSTELAKTGNITKDNYETYLNETENINEPEIEIISETIAYTRYYADIDDDGTVDGIIYADLAIGNTGDGQWSNNWGNYTIPTKTNFKKYYISQKNYTDDFGTKDVIAPVSNTTGNSRFYIMALDDFITSESEFDRYCWYSDANLPSSNTTVHSENNFGKGSSETKKMIDAWNNETYGIKNRNGSLMDMWGLIQEEVSKGWFVPSKGEWAAFGGEVAEILGITKDNRSSYNIGSEYWSSSQEDVNNAYYASINYGDMRSYLVYSNAFVRLSTTF